MAESVVFYLLIPDIYSNISLGLLGVVFVTVVMEVALGVVVVILEVTVGVLVVVIAVTADVVGVMMEVIVSLVLVVVEVTGVCSWCW